MGALAVWLGAIAVGDLIAAPGGRPESRARMVAGVLAACVVAGLLSAGVGFAAPVVAVLVVTVAASSGLWMWARSPATWTARRGMTAALTAAAVFLGMVATAGVWPASPGGLVATWQEGLPFERMAALRTDRLLSAAAVALALTATGNALVRLGLTGLDPASMGGEQRIRGGRLIGPVERLFVFGFVVSGQATAAALVISAKTLLRFPQLRWERSIATLRRPARDGDPPSTAQGRPSASIAPRDDEAAGDRAPHDDEATGDRARAEDDAVAEYLVCGSLLSWSIAVVGVLLLLA